MVLICFDYVCRDQRWLFIYVAGSKISYLWCALFVVAQNELSCPLLLLIRPSVGFAACTNWEGGLFVGTASTSSMVPSSWLNDRLQLFSPLKLLKHSESSTWKNGTKITMTHVGSLRYFQKSFPTKFTKYLQTEDKLSRSHSHTIHSYVPLFNKERYIVTHILHNGESYSNWVTSILDFHLTRFILSTKLRRAYIRVFSTISYVEMWIQNNNQKNNTQSQPKQHHTTSQF